MSTTTTILHISDLHIKAAPDKTFDRSVVLDRLLTRVKKDYEGGFRPELVAVTGDIAYAGIETEYKLAESFFVELLRALRLTPAQLFLVPGNHDVNFSKYRKSDIPAYKTVEDMNKELELDRRDLLKGMRDYFDFIDKYPHLQTALDGLIPFVTIYEAASKKRLGLIGLNSAWMCRERTDDEKIDIAIGEFQINNAMNKLKQQGTVDLTVFLFHHSIDFLWYKDRDKCRGYIDGDRSLLLTGHLHEPAGCCTEDLRGRLLQFQAGGAYLESKSNWPSRYQYVTLDWDRNMVRLVYRAYDKDNGFWHLDGKIGDDGQKEFNLFPHETPAAKGSVVTAPPVHFPDSYRQWLIESYHHLDADMLYGSEMVKLRLPKIFIPLYANPPDKPDLESEEQMPIYANPPDKLDLESEEEMPKDLEILIAKRETLLIEGQPGSGKTTLMRHVTYCLAREASPSDALTPLTGWLPVLICFKDLHDYFREHTAETGSALTIIDWCCKSRMGGTIDKDIVRTFVKQGRTLILLDGLDELPQPYRDKVVTWLNNLQRKHPGVRLVITGRPHGIGGAASTLFDQERVTINPLSKSQKEEFISKWFRYVDIGASGPGGRNAIGLAGQVKVHPAVEALIDNPLIDHPLIDTPLMLTAICILYHDQHELPGQRAVLYKRFVNNMLYRRFGAEFEEVHLFLMALAHSLHSRKTTTINESGMLAVMKQVCGKLWYEDSATYDNRITRRFLVIEPQCGFLKQETGVYEFRHLTFQEFLCAEYLSDNAADHHVAIASFWDDDWYLEMIKLYISHISVSSKAKANDLVWKALEHGDRGRQLTAAAALNDIQENRRDTRVVEKAREALLRILQTEEGVDRKTLAEAGELLGWLGDTRDLKAFVLIAGGEYDLEELGQRSISSFEIGMYPVTNGWFREFVDGGGYAEQEWWSEAGWEWRLDERVEHPQYWHDRKWLCPNAPVVGVSWWEAEAFCRWLTKAADDNLSYRLPHDVEWQTSAAGHEQREYPWGNDDGDATHCNCREGDDRIEKTSSVGIFERGKSLEGLYDLSGNIWEWCMDDKSDGLDRVIRGGAWCEPVKHGRSGYWSRILPGYRDNDTGFRLVRGQ